MAQEKTPAVSILVPVYQSAELLPLIGRNLAAQIHDNFELLFYDDGSTDGTTEVLATLMAEDSRVRVIRGEVNRGRSFARNRLLAAARFDIVAWQDADDLWEPDKLAIQAPAYFEALGQDPTLQDRLIFNSGFYQVKHSSLDCKAVQPPGSYRLEDLIEFARNDLPPIQLQTCIGHKRAFLGCGGFSEELPWAEDFEFFLRFLSAGGEVRLVGEGRPLVWYFFGLLHRSAEKIEAAHEMIAERHGKLWVERGFDPHREFLKRQLHYSYFAYLVNNEREAAIKFLFRSFSQAQGDVEIEDAVARGFLAWMDRFYKPREQSPRPNNRGTSPTELSGRLAASNKDKRIRLAFEPPDQVLIQLSLAPETVEAVVWICRHAGEKLWATTIQVVDGRGAMTLHQDRLLDLLRLGCSAMTILVGAKGVAIKRPVRIIRLSSGVLSLAPI